MLNTGKTASVASHEDLARLREAMQRFHSTAEASVANLRHQTAQALREIGQVVQVQKSYVESLESAAGSYDEEDQGEPPELTAAAERLAELEAAQAEVQSIAAAIDSGSSQFAAQLTDVIPRASDFLRVKLDILNEKAAIRVDPAGGTGATAKLPVSAPGDAPPRAPAATAQGAAAFPPNVPLPEGWRWVPLSEIALATEMSGVESPEDFKKVDYATMRQGLEAFRTKVLPALDVNRGKSLWDLNSTFRDQDAASGTSYEHGTLRAFEAFFSQEDAIYLSRGRKESHFKIINGRHRIKAAVDAGWTAIPARTKDLRS